MPISSLLMGSHPNVPLCAMQVVMGGGGGTQVRNVPAGAYYVHDATSGRSALTQFRLQVESHSSAPSLTVSITENRRVRITSTAAFGINWTGDTTLRDMLGFTGNLSSATTHDAPRVSPYLWSPSRTEIAIEAPLGIVGKTVYDTVVGSSGPANQIGTQNNSWVQNTFMWRYVPIDRVRTVNALGGEWHTFFDTVLRRIRTFKFYRDFNDSVGSATAYSLGTPLGPYQMRHERGLMDWDYKREVENVDYLSPIEIKVVQVTDL